MNLIPVYQNVLLAKGFSMVHESSFLFLAFQQAGTKLGIITTDLYTVGS